VPRRPPRLDRSLYVGLQRYFLTICAAERHKHFADHRVAIAVRDQILSIARDYRMAIVAYCFMPDHVHLLVEAGRADANLVAFVHHAKQKTGYAFARKTGRRLWQAGFHDRILRNADVTLSVARYIFENPVRAGLVASPADYQLLGSEQYTIAEVLDAVRWQP
jgi:putative transposase